MKKLKKLEDHNKEKSLDNSFIISKSPQLNGIACPKCGAELLDTHPTMVLYSNPPQKNIHCGECGYVGFRLA